MEDTKNRLVVGDEFYITTPTGHSERVRAFGYEGERPIGVVFASQHFRDGSPAIPCEMVVDGLNEAWEGIKPPSPTLTRVSPQPIYHSTDARLDTFKNAIDDAWRTMSNEVTR